MQIRRGMKREGLGGNAGAMGFWVKSIAAWWIVGMPLLVGAESLPNGVSAGDVTSTTAVLWARATLTGDLAFEWSTDPVFETVDGTVTLPVVNVTVPVKTLIDDLQPGTSYFFRATDAAEANSPGHFHTAPAANVCEHVHFGVTGDWRGELNPYPGIVNVSLNEPEFLVKLGDTVYADVASPDFPFDQAVTVEEYRIKHNEVYGERYGVNSWLDAHASTAIYAMIDDHEVTNDFAGGAPPSSDERFAGYEGEYINETEFYLNGLQAFGEYNAIEDLTWEVADDARLNGKPKLYRAVTFGKSAAIFLIDARSFRDEELPAVVNPFDPVELTAFLIASFDPSRTMLGRAQMDQVKGDLLAAQAAGVVWKFVMVPEPIQNLGPVGAQDRFEGYAAERTELLKHINDNNLSNVVFVAADIHGTIVNNLEYQDFVGGPQIPVPSWEITTGALAYDAPFGPTVVQIAAAIGLLTPEAVAYYESLPREGQDSFLQELVDTVLLIFGYDLIGLEDSTIPATLISGTYAATHTYGWTEFEVDDETFDLTVTTWGIDYYTQAELEADPDAIIAREPEIVSQFVVTAVDLGCPGDANGDTTVDPLDAGYVQARFGCSVDASDLECIAADVNCDGAVDPLDVGYALARFGVCE